MQTTSLHHQRLGIWQKYSPSLEKPAGHIAVALFAISLAAGIKISKTFSATLIFGNASGLVLGTIIFVVMAKVFFHFFENQLGAEVKHLVPKEVPGNSVLLTLNALESAERKIELVQHAEKSIEFSGNFCGSHLFIRLLDGIEERLEIKPHLKVHILGNWEMLDWASQRKLSALQKKYPEQVHFLVSLPKFIFHPEIRVRDNHVKTLIVDETYFIMGGSNLHSCFCQSGDDLEEKPTYFQKFRHLFATRGTRDMDVVGKGPIAKVMREEFFKLYTTWAFKMKSTYFPVYAPVQGNVAQIKEIDEHSSLHHAVSLKLSVNDKEAGITQCIDEYVAEILKEKKKLVLGQLIVMPDEKITRALKQVAEQDTKIVFISNGLNGNIPNSILALHSEQKIRELFPIKKVKLYAYQSPHVMYHKKVLLRKKVMIIGSFNLGDRSVNDDEWVLTIYSKKVAKEASLILKRDIALSERVDLEKKTNHLLLKAKEEAISFLLNITRPFIERLV